MGKPLPLGTRVWGQNASFVQTDEHPVINVGWNDTIAFAQWLSRKEGVTYRLPTDYKHSPFDDPQGVERAAYRVYRGGGWDGAAYWTRSATRFWHAPVGSFGPAWYRTLGFRLARVPSVR
jgi:formylglycine-generating enzyme required for sulfatase activity